MIITNSALRASLVIYIISYPARPSRIIVKYNWIGTSGFEVKIENERLTVICSRSRQNLKCGSQVTRLFWRIP